MSDAPPEPTAAMTYRPSHPLDIGFAVLGAKTVRRRAGVYWWTTETPEGSAVVTFREGSGLVRADSWAPAPTGR